MMNADHEIEADRPDRWRILAVLVISEFVVELDTTIVNVALPDIAKQLHPTTGGLQWVIDAYTLTFGGLMLLSGALSDRWGRRRVLSGGLVLFALSSLVAGFAGSTGVLTGGRALMGVGAALILPTTLAILTHVFPAGERAKALSAWAAAGGLAFVLGPVVGGALVNGYGWEAVFFVNLVVVAIALAGIRAYVPAGRSEGVESPDLLGAALSIAGLGLLVFAIVEGPRNGWGSASTAIEFVAAAALIASFFAWEARAPAPMLDLRLFRDRAFSASAATIGLCFIGVGGVLFVLTLVLQDVQGHSALGAGVRLLPVAATLLLFSPSSVVLEAKVGTKAVVAVGLALMAVGDALLVTVDRDSSYLVIGAGLAIAGAGYGLALTPLVNAITNSLTLSRVGTSTGLYNAVIIVGLALGVAVIGSVASTRYGQLIEGATAGLPPDLADGARDSVAQALTIASQLPGDSGAALAAGSRDAFAEAASRGFLVAACVAALGALVAALFLPSRPAVAEPETESEPTSAAAHATVTES